MSGTDLSSRRPTAQALLPLMIAILSCFLSGSLTIHFCWALRETETLFSAIWAVGMGAVWELGKLAFAPMGLRLLASRSAREIATGLALCCLSGVLITGSIIASVGYFARVDEQQQQDAMHASRRYQDLRTQVENIDGQMQILTRAADADNQAGYRTRAMHTLAQLRNLQKDRMHLSQQLDAMESSGANYGSDNASGIFRTLGAFMSGDVATNASRLKLLAHIVVAGVLEMLGIASVWLLRRQAGGVVAAHPHDDFKSDANASANANTRANTQLHFSLPTPRLPDAVNTDAIVAKNTKSDASGAKEEIAFETQNAQRITANPDSISGRKATANSDFDAGYQRAKNLIRSGEIAPTYRAIQSALRVGQETVQKYLKAMIDEGLICRAGRRYCVELGHFAV